MKVLRALSLLALASCGGFLPFIGDDQDETPPSPPLADAAVEASSDATVDATADATTDALVSVGCAPSKGACVLPSDCCSGLECRAAACCVSGGQYANAAADCCSGTGKFEGFAGWLCLDDS